MSLESAVARGRALMESKLLVDTCKIERSSGEVTGPTGVVTETWATVYTGACRLKTERTMGQGSTIGEAYVIVGRQVLQLPVTATGLLEGDRVTMLTSAYDPDVPGRTYRVREVGQSSFPTRREVTVTELTS